MGKPLTALSAEKFAKTKGRVSDGNGLFLRTLAPGRAYWVHRFRINGKEREISLGSYRTMTLVEARAKHAESRALVLNGVDPLAAKEGVTPRDTPRAPTFGAKADEYVAEFRITWHSAKYAHQFLATLTQHAKPIWNMPVDKIATDDVKRVLKPIWATMPETAQRVRERIARVIDFAREDDDPKPNPARWKGHLDTKMADPKKIVGKAVKHHKAMPYADVPAFMAELAEVGSTTSRALQFTILTACRTSEVLGARWDEVDWDRAVWTVPAVRMKVGKQEGQPHQVPLSDAAVAILKAQQGIRTRSPFVFPGRPEKSLSTMAMSAQADRLGTDATVHGFRSSFRNWAHVVAKARFEVAEQCLAHVVGNAVTRAYLTSTGLEVRAPLMQRWADYVTGSDASNVIELRRAGA